MSQAIKFGDLAAADRGVADLEADFVRILRERDRLRDALTRVRVNLVGSNSRERKRLIEYIGSVLEGES